MFAETMDALHFDYAAGSWDAQRGGRQECTRGSGCREREMGNFCRCDAVSVEMRAGEKVG